MGLDGHQARRHHQQRRIGQDAVPEGTHKVLLFRDTVRKVDDNGHLGNLRGLEVEQLAHTDPAGRALDRNGKGVAGNRHKDKKEDGHVQQGLRDAPETAVVNLTDEQHPGNSHDGKDGLPDKPIGGIVVLGVVISGGETGGQQHHQADGHQQQYQQAEREVDGAPGQLLALRLQRLLAEAELLAALGLLPAQGTAAGPLGGLALRHGEGDDDALPDWGGPPCRGGLPPLLGGPPLGLRTPLGFRTPLGLPPCR